MIALSLPLPARRPAPTVVVGGVPIGGGAPVTVQTMTKCKTSDAKATIAEIRSSVGIDPARDLDRRSQDLLRQAGLWERACALAPISADLTRVSVPDEASAAALPDILAASPIPVVADIHFKHRMALAAIDAGVHKIRWNPGNILDRKLIQEIVAGCKEKNIPMRVGVNGGSLPRDLREKYAHDTVTALVESALRSVALVEECGYTNLVVSLKASRCDLMIAAYRQMARRSSYPLHLGVTEAGAGAAAVTASYVGIGSLLLDGIGDTIRVSLTENSALEVVVGRLLVDALTAKRQQDVAERPC